MAARIYTADTEEVAEQEVESAADDGHHQQHSNDDFDDVFGSAPASPTSHEHNNNSEAHDGFEGGENTSGSRNAEEWWSDIPRLKEKHETEGYRDGITKGKAQTVQMGFDEGYGLGATLGLRVGKILGLLEGICGAVRSKGMDVDVADKMSEGEWAEQGPRVKELYVHAKAELGTRSVFGREWWGEDGIWTFDVPGEEGEVLFPDVAAAHPLVVKWEKLVQDEAETWGLDLSLMEREHHDEKEAVMLSKSKEQQPPASMAPGAAKDLAW